MDVPEPQVPPPELQALVDRRGALRARMVELRASDPDDHDGFLRTVDQLLAVSNEIIDRLNPSAPTAAASREEGSGGIGGEGSEGSGRVER